MYRKKCVNDSNFGKEGAGKTGGYRADCIQKWVLIADYVVIKSCHILNEIDIPDIGSGWAT